jgi:SET domain-containing protein 6
LLIIPSSVVVLESDLEVPLALVSLIRLLRLTADEWEKTVEKDKVPKPKLDTEVLAVVCAVLERRLKEYPSTFDVRLCFHFRILSTYFLNMHFLSQDDVELLRDESLSLNRRLALVVRIGEKRILQSAIQKIKAQQLEAQKGDGSRKRKTRPDQEGERMSKTQRR